MSALPLPGHPAWRLLLATLLGALQCLGEASAQAPALAKETAVKAAFLSKFAGFVEWPAGAQRRSDEPLVIGVVGNEAVAADLDQIIRAQPAGSNAMTVRRLREGDGAAGLHILFIGAGRDTRVKDQTTAVRGPVLIVTEQEDGLRLGGVLNFVVDDGRVRFAASVPAASARGLHLNARLLAVARSVDVGDR